MLASPPLTRLCEEACALVAKAEDKVLNWVDERLAEAIDVGMAEAKQEEIDNSEGWA